MSPARFFYFTMLIVAGFASAAPLPRIEDGGFPVGRSGPVINPRVTVYELERWVTPYVYAVDPSVTGVPEIVPRTVTVHEDRSLPTTQPVALMPRQTPEADR
ncbi:hypothetical protein DL96DRAFT_1616243 [Flagelloscypha sp. PMI_526]|nr:hypothetical protein DL96DRAFT_1616243 [Flagelloscypha sp. PMI_526]